MGVGQPSTGLIVDSRAHLPYWGLEPLSKR